MQQSDEWFAARVGKVTASNVWRVLARTQSGWSAERANYRADLVVERLTGVRHEIKTTAAMQWGIDQEQFARGAYEVDQGCFVDEVGFIEHPTIQMSGASPDGLIGDDGLLEIKCPETKTVIDIWLNDKIPEKHLHQINWQLACTRRNWCDYVVFDSRMPKELQLYIQRVHRNSETIAKMETEVQTFLDEVDKLVNKLKELK